ncbi:MAG: inositol monophosphatase family protein [Actinomycetota bacterium]
MGDSSGREAAKRLAWAEGVAREVGHLLLARFRSGIMPERKASGVVTELDYEAEAMIVRDLEQAFPGDGLVSEEGAGREAAGSWRWIVDPLDGTTNYVAGLPMFAVSLACLDDRGTVLGVVHAPALSETFSAVRGEGAWGPHGPLAVTDTAGLSDAIFVVNKAYHPASFVWQASGRLLAAIRAYRTLGCVSLDLALVAAGRPDGVVILPTDPWDVAAGALLLSEAGAVLADLAGHAPQPGRRTGILAANRALFDQALPLLNPPDRS